MRTVKMSPVALKCVMAASLALSIAGVGSADWPPNPEKTQWVNGAGQPIWSACEKQTGFTCIAEGCWAKQIAAEYRTCFATIYPRAKRESAEHPVGKCVTATTETVCGIRDYVYCAELRVYDDDDECINFQCNTYVKYYGGGLACDPDDGGWW